MSKDGLKIKGSFRLQIVDPEKGVVGDSGWRRNQITDLGYNHYLIENLVGSANSKRVTHIALGTGTAPAVAATGLAGEIDHGVNRLAITSATSSNSRKMRFTGTFASSLGYITTTVTLQNIGLFATSTRTTGTIFAGNTYATSTCASNQAINLTYDLDFT